MFVPRRLVHEIHDLSVSKKVVCLKSTGSRSSLAEIVLCIRTLRSFGTEILSGCLTTVKLSVQCPSTEPVQANQLGETPGASPSAASQAKRARAQACRKNCRAQEVKSRDYRTQSDYNCVILSGRRPTPPRVCRACLGRFPLNFFRVGGEISSRWNRLQVAMTFEPFRNF
jgi:hypothetical protein